MADAMRPTIFLYTDAAQIDARTKKAMIAAGFLPVKVATLDAVKFLEPAIRFNAELDPIQRAALNAIVEHEDSYPAREFGPMLAKLLLAASDSA